MNFRINQDRIYTFGPFLERTEELGDFGVHIQGTMKVAAQLDQMVKLANRKITIFGQGIQYKSRK